MSKTLSVDTVISDNSNSVENNLNNIQDLISSYRVGTPNIGMLRLAQVVSTDPAQNKATLYVVSDKASNVTTSYPGFMSMPNGDSGLWYGLKKGDIVWCGIGAGNTYYIHNKIGNLNTHLQNLTLTDPTINAKILQTQTNINLQDLLPGSFLLKAGNIKLKLDESKSAFIGNLSYGSININISEYAKQNSSTTFISNQLYNFSSSSSKVTGIVLRDKRDSAQSEQFNDPKLYTDWTSKLTQINFDPSLISAEQTHDKIQRNPPLNEDREVFYESPEYYLIESDDKEVKKQTLLNNNSNKNPLTSRHARKEDAFNLSLVCPNQLFEKIIGTGVDVNGNILDINRNILPLGANGNIQLDGSEKNFRQIKQLHRKGISFHFEQNSKKNHVNLNVETGEGASYAQNNDLNFKKHRSRLFFDIDKEGQIKLNIPASSETGNVAMHTRYENVSTVNPAKINNENDYDHFSKSSNKQDIIFEQIGFPNIELKSVSNDKVIPTDRLTNKSIKLGTVYHDISKTCIFPIENADTKDQFRCGILSGPDNYVADINKQFRKLLKHTPENSVVSTEINIDGYNANAGGRSFTANFDGMLNISVGANTIDKQSAWFDFQGGIVTRIGADKNGISSITQTDGDVYLQIGGDMGIRNSDGYLLETDPDPRFANNTNIVQINSNKTQRFELRVMQGNGQYCRVLIDNEGILIAHPKTIEFRTDENILMYAGGEIRMSGENIRMHADDVQNLDTPVHRQSRTYDSVYEKDASGDGVNTMKPYFGSQRG